MPRGFPFQDNRADAKEFYRKAHREWIKKISLLRQKGILVYKCGYRTCNAYFHNKRDLEIHLRRTVHKMVPKPNKWVTPDQKVYKCGYINCNKTFVNKKDAQSHTYGHIRI